MKYAQLTPNYAVAPQIEASDAAEIRAAGFTDVICNRPDAEVGPDLFADEIGAELLAQGLNFHINPVAGSGLTGQEVPRQAEIIAAAKGPVLAYCRSGTRSATIWALGEKTLDADEIVSAAAGAGYDLSHLRGNVGRR